MRSRLIFCWSLGAAAAFHGAFWWALGITVVALVPALALPAPRRTGNR